MADKDGMIEYNKFLSMHKVQLETSGVPLHFWPSLFRKLKDEIFDAGDAFSMFEIDYTNSVREDSDPLYKVVVTKEDGLSHQDGFNIYIIDHAWTYQIENAVQDLSTIPGLLDRMCQLMKISTSLSEEDKINSVMKDMWLYNQTYKHGIGPSYWYIMDEFGSAIQHSDNFNCRVVPFYCLLNQMVYSLLFLVKDIHFEEEVTRDFVEGLPEPKARDAVLLPWKPKSFINVSYAHKEFDDSYFESGHVKETLPVIGDIDICDSGKILNVYSEYRFIVEYLNDPNFLIVDSPEEADILWLTNHFKLYREFSLDHPHKFVNQFPYENVLTIKDLFNIVCRKKGTKTINGDFENPRWLPVTYNLTNELIEFCSYFQNRARDNLDNHWICKPFNLARGLDIYITDNLNCILRLPFVGPKIAQKYIERPVLFDRPDIGLVKFDVRYVLLLKSVKPLVAFAYKNFFLRFANKPFDLDNLTDYQKHFTVMNYQTEASLMKMLCADFIIAFNKQYPNHSWVDVEAKIFKALKEMFEAATMAPPPCGIGESPQSRALYAVDLMLDWGASGEIQPKLLELNWMPDCKRACEYYPDFYNDIFLLLFKNKSNDSKFQLL